MAAPSAACHVLVPLAGAALLFFVGGWMTHLWFRFTPVYQDIVCKLGQPKVQGVHFGVVGLTATTLTLELAAVCTNPNFYTIGVGSAEKGQVTMTNDRIPVGWSMASPSSTSALPAHGSGTIYTTSEVRVSGAMLTQMMPHLLGGKGIPVYMEMSNQVRIDISFFFGQWGISQWFRKKCGMEIASLLDLVDSKDQIGPVACADSWGDLMVPRLTDTGTDEIVMDAQQMSPSEIRKGALAKNLGLGGAAVLFYAGGLALLACACWRFWYPPGKDGFALDSRESWAGWSGSE